MNQLRKQDLLSDEPLSFDDIAKKQLGLHSTDYWTPYLSVFARIGDYHPEDIFRSLNQGDRLVRINAFRKTVFLIHKENLAMIFQATGNRFYDEVRRSVYLKDFTDEQINQVMKQIIDTLDSVPLTTRKLKQELPELAPNMRGFLLGAMARGEVVRATAKHARSNLTTYTPTSNWVNVDLNQMSEEKALNMLIQHYIEVFGPISKIDLAWWLGLPQKKVKEKLAELNTELVTHVINKSPFYIEQNDFEIAKSLEHPSESIINFLPYEDHFPKAFIDRSWFISGKYQFKLFPRNKKSYWPSQPTQVLEPTSRGMNQSGEIRPSIWLNEQIIGRWELEKSKSGYNVIMSLYQKVEPSLEQIIQEKKNRLERFINEKLVPISE
jgi:hypothetical protein